MVESSKSTGDIVRAPHPPLTGYYQDEAQRRHWVQRLFDGAAADYDRTESMVGFGSGSWYRYEALLRAGLQPGMQILDVGTGTGLVARRAAEIVGNPTLVTGLDPSPGMLASAKLPFGVKLVEGIAENIPFPDSSFDFVSMGYALRHISDLSVAFREFCRVLRPGGRLCILEITRPESGFLTMLLKGYMGGVVPALVRLTSKKSDTPMMWSYYWDTIAACVPPSQVVHTLENSGFQEVDRHLELKIFSEFRARKGSATP
ncbi:MAG: class I SAM-dependent methyltransferase [Prolixibacteraceae bacterium]|nr:class I SAM-dependent methyltransferase [Burkholderiales bacterium]